MEFFDLKKQQEVIKVQFLKRVDKVLDHGKYILGPEVYELEEKLSDYVGVKHCVSCSSGTDALLISLMANNVGKGDAVFTTSFSYIATAEVAKLLGATVIFCDINHETFNICPLSLQNEISIAKEKKLNPKAIIAVDIFGLPARYRELDDIAKSNSLYLIQDMAQSFGSSIRSEKSGTFGDISATSFFPTKPLGCYGDGGAIFTDSDTLADLARSIRVHGGGKDKYDNVRLGINGRLDTIQACILLEKLTIFDEELKIRKQLSDYYNENISNKFQKQYLPADYKSAHALYSILAESREHKTIVLQNLKKQNIPFGVYYEKPLHLQGVFKEANNQDLSIVSDISSRVFSIPFHSYLSDAERKKVVEVVNDS